MALGVGDESWSTDWGSPYWWSLLTTSLGPLGPGKAGTGKEGRCAGIGAVAVVGPQENMAQHVWGLPILAPP